jgi:hypothetical protein
MTPDEIRSLYVETLARAQRVIDLRSHPELSNGTPREMWGRLDERMRDEYRAHAAHFADALAEAGLLPTAVDSRYIGRGMQRRWRLATGWKEPGE